MDFHIWDLDRVNIKLKSSFIYKINDRIQKKFGSKPKAYKKIFKNSEIPFSTFKNILKSSYNKYFFVSLKNYIKIAEKIGISKEELEENIISYKTAGGINYIETPILPIRINPVFHMVFAHNIGDGTVINSKKGRLPYFGYRQFNEFYRLAYIKKIEWIFGKIKFQKDYFKTSTRPYCPSVLSSLFFKYYNLKIEDFLSDKARIPNIIFQDKDSLLAVLIAFIIDEGNIDSTQITINLKNTLLIKDLKRICDILNYNSKITQGKKESENDYARLHILREGMKELYKNYLELNKIYPIIDLGIKGKRIESSFKIYSRMIYKTGGNRNLILEILKKEQMSVNQLAERINMTRQGIRFHIHKLLNDRKIKVIDNTKLNWIYGV
jgi:hypothetical protein